MKWVVFLDGPEPMGRWFEDRKRAERWLRRQKAKGLHPFLVDMEQTFEDMEPEETK